MRTNLIMLHKSEGGNPTHDDTCCRSITNPDTSISTYGDLESYGFYIFLDGIVHFSSATRNLAIACYTSWIWNQCTFDVLL